jgi:hypothetical protein
VTVRAYRAQIGDRIDLIVRRHERQLDRVMDMDEVLTERPVAILEGVRAR